MDGRKIGEWHHLVVCLVGLREAEPNQRKV